MKTSNLQIEAFHIIAQLGSFSKAAQELHITQPALSRRIKELEEFFNARFFIRSQAGIKLTEQGLRLLKYSNTLGQLEEELFFDLSKKTDRELGGMIKITSYASIMHPVVLPALAPFMTKHPHVQITCLVLYLSQIPEVLFMGQTDLAITNNKIERVDIENHLIGYEHYVLTESTKVSGRNDIFLDISPNDETTEQFFQIQKKKPKRYHRSFMNDEWGILVGTELGIGRAVKPRHMIYAHSEIRVLPGYKPLIKPVYLHYRRQHDYTKLHQSVIDILIKDSKQFLGGA
ncbi:MAG: LysR family transcriptional regulator [Deltaproteobacteria bacterium]|nr:LysR family transcriptional regulator [Deltaproteobacteria bacterium]